MKNRLDLFTIVVLMAAAAPGRALLAAYDQPAYAVRPSCNGNPCVIRPGTYGYNDTTWRVWPTQYRPEVSDPRAIGAHRVPAPPGGPEVKAPPAEGVPGRPPISGGTEAQPMILPNLGPSTSGTRTAPGSSGLPMPGER